MYASTVRRMTLQCTSQCRKLLVASHCLTLWATLCMLSPAGVPYLWNFVHGAVLLQDAALCAIPSSALVMPDDQQRQATCRVQEGV